MQEFSSVTASSYDAGSLAPLLNEKAADGWSVVSIVAAGTNIVAYLQREAGDDTSGADASVFAAAAVTESEDTPAPVEEPAGWASVPDEPTTDEPTDAMADEPTEVAEPVVEPFVETAPVAETAPAADPAVPAGWYADPSRRFELRYWDGAAWTEHVSRAGQQFTDPPVA